MQFLVFINGENYVFIWGRIFSFDGVALYWQVVIVLAYISMLVCVRYSLLGRNLRYEASSKH
jgi:hypothetical protein